VISFYLIQLEIKDTKDTDRFPAYIDIHLNIDSKGRLATKRYDKKDNLNFPIVEHNLYPYVCRLFVLQLRVRNSCVGSREVKCFNAIAGGDGSRLYVLLHIFIVLLLK
jgi:hypothetical protein